MAENVQLEDLIQQYLDGTKVSDKILSDDNPLFVVNGRFVVKFFKFLFHSSLILSCVSLSLFSLFKSFFRANLNHVPVARSKKPTIQDATTIQVTAQKQLF